MLLVPLLLVILGLLVVGMRIWLVRGTLGQAAEAGARAGALARSAAEADLAARAAMTGAVAQSPYTCRNLSVSVDVSGFRVPPGTAAEISTGLSCSLQLEDVALPGLPGSLSVSGSGRAILDLYRGRG